MNIELFIFLVIFSYLSLVILYSKNKKEGLYFYTIIMSIISILVSIKNIEIMDIEIPLGIIPMSTIFITINLLVQKNGLEALKKVISMLIISNALVMVLLICTSSITSGQYGTFNDVYDLLIKSKIRQIISISIVSIISIWQNGSLYYQIKRNKNNIFISNIFTIFIISFINALLLCTIGFLFLIDLKEIMLMISLTYIFELIVGIFGILIVYITRDVEN